MKKAVGIQDMVETGVLYLGFTWEYAINDAVKKFIDPIKPVFKDSRLDLLLADEREFSHYEMTITDKRRRFKTRIPASLNSYVAEVLERRNGESPITNNGIR